ncbi:MAG: endonuclease/exonuclease/phosphatase family protein [Bacteroidota bacterium]
MLMVGCADLEPDPEPETEREPVRIVSMNIWHDQSDWEGRLGMMIDTFRVLMPEVICLQEVLEHPAMPNQARLIADSLGYEHHFASVDTAGHPRRLGNAVLLRGSISEASESHLDHLGDRRSVAHVQTELEGRSVDVYCTRLHYAEGDTADIIREEQVGQLIAFIDSTADADMVVVAGDLAAEPDADVLEPLRSAYFDTYELSGVTSVRPTSLNPFIGHRPRWVDYVFVDDERLDVRSVRTMFVSPDPSGLWASDHFGVLVELHMRRSRR